MTIFNYDLFKVSKMTIFNYELFKVSNSSVKESSPGNFLKAQFVIFRCQNMQKRAHRNDKKSLPRDFKKCPERLCFTLLSL